MPWDWQVWSVMIIKNDRPPILARTKAALKQLYSRQKLKMNLYVLAAILLIVAILSLLTKTVQPQVIISPTADFHQQAVKVDLDHTLALGNYQLRFTTDGSDPTPASQLYTEPIQIEKTTVIKTALFRQETQISPILIKTYFIKANHTLPVVSLITEPKNLWDDEIGIYTTGNHINYKQSGKEWERPAEFIYYQDQQFEYQRDVGVRIHGTGSRELPQKSFRLTASYQDERELFQYDFFPNDGLTTHDEIVLRNAGTDWRGAYLRDALIHNLAQQSTDLDVMPSQPVVLYLNGEYWGIYYIRERFDDHYFEEKYGVTRDRLTILDVPHNHGETRGQAELTQGYESDRDRYNEMLVKAMGCRGCPEYNEYRKLIDMDNFIDYNIFEMHFANFDWPYGNSKVWVYHNNILAENPDEVLELPPGIDGRFRWLLFDLDAGLGHTSDTHEKMIAAAGKGMLGILIDDQFPLRNIFYNTTFKENFLNRYANLLNTVLSSKQAIAELDRMEAVIEPEMPNQIARWKDYTSPYGISQFQSMEDWHYQVDLVRTYLKYRQEGAQNQVFEELYTDDDGNFTTSRTEMIKLYLDVSDPAGGDIQVHTTTYQGENAPYENKYFPDQSINIKALPNAGWRFSHWEGDVPAAKKQQSQLRINLSQDQSLKAVFVKGWLF